MLHSQDPSPALASPVEGHMALWKLRQASKVPYGLTQGKPLETRFNIPVNTLCFLKNLESN